MWKGICRNASTCNCVVRDKHSHYMPKHSLAHAWGPLPLSHSTVACCPHLSSALPENRREAGEERVGEAQSSINFPEPMIQVVKSMDRAILGVRSAAVSYMRLSHPSRCTC